MVASRHVATTRRLTAQLERHLRTPPRPVSKPKSSPRLHRTHILLYAGHTRVHMVSLFIGKRARIQVPLAFSWPPTKRPASQITSPDPPSKEAPKLAEVQQLCASTAFGNAAVRRQVRCRLEAALEAFVAGGGAQWKDVRTFV